MLLGAVMAVIRFMNQAFFSDQIFVVSSFSSLVNEFIVTKRCCLIPELPLFRRLPSKLALPFTFVRFL